MAGVWKIFNFEDIHSHVEGEGRVLSVDFTEAAHPQIPGQPFTLGVHPWNASKDVDWEDFEKALENKDIVGIGEAGLDSLKGAALEVQLPVFIKQIELSVKHRLPLVIHNVRNSHNILALHKKYNPDVPWIIHGFRGNLQQARQLLDAGLHLSLGKNARPEVAAISSPFIHKESDEEKTQ